MARFRCCGRHNTDGHAEDCSLKPPTTKTPERTPPPEVEDGCRFDILRFEHIGECRGTCGEQGRAIQFADESEGKMKIVIVMVEAGDDPAETIKELEARGFRHLTEEELSEIVAAEARGGLEVEVQVLTLDEIKATFPRRGLPEENPNPFLTIKEAAKELQFSESWVRKLCARGRLEGAMKLNRRWAIPHDAIYMKEES